MPADEVEKSINLLEETKVEEDSNLLHFREMCRIETVESSEMAIMLSAGANSGIVEDSMLSNCTWNDDAPKPFKS